MPLYSYKGLNPAGQTVTGEVDAASRQQAVVKLGTQGVRPIAITVQDQGEALPATETVELYQQESEPKRRRWRLGGRGGKSGVSLSFFQKLLVLLSSGLPLGDALKLLSIRLSDPVLKDLSADLWKRLTEGSTLAHALAERPEYFADSTVHLVEAGEASGNLVPILERIVTYMEETAELRKKVIGNLSYPITVCLLAFGVLGFFLIFLLPKVRSMLESLGGEMQLFARLLIEGSDLLVKASPFLALALVLVIAVLHTWRRTTAGRTLTDLWLLKLPFLGDIYLYSSIFQTSSLLATLMGSGVNTTEALRLTEKTIPNTILRGKFATARRQIQEGVSMATAIKRVRYMPDLAMDILTVGENTGNLVSSLRDINRIYRAELTRNLSLLTNAISTGALLFAFTFVTVIALAIVSSVLQISNSLVGPK